MNVGGKTAKPLPGNGPSSEVSLLVFVNTEHHNRA